MRHEDQDADGDGSKGGQQDGRARNVECLANPVVMFFADGSRKPFNRGIKEFRDENGYDTEREKAPFQERDAEVEPDNQYGERGQ